MSKFLILDGPERTTFCAAHTIQYNRMRGLLGQIVYDLVTDHAVSTEALTMYEVLM